jgi:hypothetical protein
MEGVWVAVPTTTIQIGGSAHVRDAMKMTDFTSTALKRTFPIIYFGTLDAAPEPASDRSGHATQPVAASAAQMPLGPVNVQHVDPASGASGRTVAELVARRAELSGTSVRVRGTVVKVTPGVLGRTYLHVRDGSGDAADATNDVAVTTDTTPTVGDLVIVEGVLAINRDIGSGYLFPVIIENAQVAKTP